ncbi:hypothetical protein [Paenibacillus polymyxa]|uniref:hypothetical protein n=1 Tax=Paenibacillus polymyxa TaxID=1406 RepID=UPI0025B68615|nr:hypothetical protein [Paenibacillus polymyxa]MDN4084861.1 hypothetical protein [Paenibacillus polymyxa]MDN4108359.1 hypothetical protein [Paenibacillus polymyxa]
MRDGSASDGSNQYKDKSAEQNNFGQQKTQTDITNESLLQKNIDKYIHILYNLYMDKIHMGLYEF